MPQHKSQHFVPRCYLRNFSVSQGSKTISLYNIERNLVIKSAPIKSQCAGSYFYGKDEFELILSGIESKYAEFITRGLLCEPRRLVDGLDDFIKFFVLIQFGRTEAHAVKMRAFYALATELAGLPEDHPDSIELNQVSEVELAREGVYFALQMRDAMQDLKVTYVKNRSRKDFITSDNPVVMTNRLYLQRIGVKTFGVSSAGAIFYLPLNPREAVIIYDRDVYHLPKSSSIFANIDRESDIDCLNGLSIINAASNIYFGSDDVVDLKLFDAAAKCRIAEPHIGRIAELVEETDEGKVFRVVDERPNEGGYLMHISQDHSTPPAWPKFLSFRSRASAFGNGSSAGLVRRGTIPSSGNGFKKVYL